MDLVCSGTLQGLLVHPSRWVGSPTPWAREKIMKEFQQGLEELRVGASQLILYVKFPTSNCYHLIELASDLEAVM